MCVFVSASRSVDSLLEQAREWEQSADYSRAVECYLKVKDDSNAALMEKCWMKVTDWCAHISFMLHNKEVS